VKSAHELRKILKRIDLKMAEYRHPKLLPSRIAGDVIAEMASQREIFLEAAKIATAGLKKYPMHPSLLIRRARALRHVVEGKLTYPGADAAEKDLKTVLVFDPDNLEAAEELLDMLFVHSAVKNKDAARMARQLAEIPARAFRRFLAIQIQAMGYAGRAVDARRLGHRWLKVFPKSRALKDALAQIRGFI
jgi:hypothetical protein